MAREGTCRIEGCGRPVVVVRDPLCQSHYTQKRSGQPFREIQARGKRLAPPEEACSFPPCQRPARAKGFCNTHYLQNYHGRPLRIPKPPVPTTSRDENGNKWCSTCETWRPEADFASGKTHKDGLQTRCRPCNAAIYRSRAELIRDKMREQRFGISREKFDAILASQGNRCSICRTDNPGSSHWAVDHDHACCPSSDKTCGNCVRGILCGRCNQGIGFLRDDQALLIRAAEYLAEHSLKAVS